MAWDTEAQNLAVNVIAKVEGSGAWDAINLRDPITVGLMQWFGTRAASILKDMKDNGTWNAPVVLDTLSAQLSSSLTPVTSRYWTSRWLTGGEASALKPILRANKPIQSATVSSDIDDYKKVAINLGMNPDTNTKAVQFYCCMYHQTPARANRIVNQVGANSSLNRLWAACMNDPIFGQYKSRYNTAYNLIATGTSPEIIDLNDDDAPSSDGDGDNEAPAANDGERVLGDIRYLSIVGDVIHVRLKGGRTLQALPSAGERFVIPRSSLTSGAAPEIPDDEANTGEPKPPPYEGDVSAAQQTLIDYADSILGEWVYTNDSRRVRAHETKAGDCSAFVRECYKRVGVSLGLLTSSQYTQGKRIYSGSPVNLKISDLRVGDLVYMHWANPRWNSGKVTDHVEMLYSVSGQGQVVGHPGPGRGPRRFTTASAYTYFQGADKIWVQRHLS